MIQTVPADPFMRKVVLPSIIRISDAWTGSTLSRRMNRNKSLRPLKTGVTSHSFRAVIKQLTLEFE